MPASGKHEQAFSAVLTLEENPAPQLDLYRERLRTLASNFTTFQNWTDFAEWPSRW